MTRSASEIAHEGLKILDPISAGAIDDVIDQTGLGAGMRALDVGCGKGELLIRLAERTGGGGLGLDLSEGYVAAARGEAARRAPQVAFEVADTRGREFAGYDLAACVGSSHALGADPLTRLGDAVVEGGLVLLGDGFWRRRPEAEYLAALGAREDELGTYGDLIASAAARGLTALYARVASEEDWDRYEWSLVANAEREGSPEARAYAQSLRSRMTAPGGRDTLGFGLFLFRRDG